MSNSKARFPQSSGSTIKNPAKSSTTGSKAIATKTAANTTAGIAGKGSSHVPSVPFNGKNLAPQSLIQRKHIGGDGGHKRNKVDRGFVEKNETIDEDAIDETDKPILPTNRAKRLESNAGLTGPHGSSGGNVHGKSATGSTMSMQFGKNKSMVEEFCTVQLNETTTTILFSMTSLVVASDTREVVLTDERNTRYENVIKSHSNVDGFYSRPSQTVNLPQKTQSEMAAPNPLRDADTQATAYDIKDITCGIDTTAQDAADAVVAGTATEGQVEDLTGVNNSIRKFVIDTVGASMVTPGCLLDTTNVLKPLGAGELANQNKPNKYKNKAGLSTTKATSTGMTSTAGVGNSGDDHNNSEQYNTDAMSVSIKKVDSGSASKDGVSASSGNIEHAINPSGMIGGSRANNSSDNPDGIAYNENTINFSAEDTQELIRAAEVKDILSNPLLLKRLHMIERAIQQNANHRPQLDYRDLPDIEPLSLLSSERAKALRDASEGGAGKGGIGKGKAGLGAHIGSDALAHTLGGALLGGLGSSTRGDADNGSESGSKKNNTHDSSPKVKKLFSYSNIELIQGRAVTAMVWNAVSSDLLAVGYGKTDVISDVHKPGEALDEEKQGGLVLFWSLRNPDYPEKILRTSQPVTALDFSKQHPMTLAVGLLNGDVNVYDVRREGANWGVPVESSAGMQGGHTDPVWQLKWIVKGAERLETLVSISTDGRVLEWNLKKGLVVSSLMQLKKSGTGEGWISNSAAGLSLDFHPTDPSTYITGTEDGSLHRCSVSYNEQYLETYNPHEGPVYRIKFSTRWPNIFLTCSADWSLSLYHLKFKAPMLSMRATGENFPINDISWCPDNSTVFANVTVDAKLQIWDLSVSSIDPVVTLDTALEDVQTAASAEGTTESLATGADSTNPTATTTLPSSPPSSPPLLSTTRYNGDRTEHHSKDDHIGTAAPLQKILKNLAQNTKKKVLTTVLFGEKNPSVVVGDNRGTVTVYRVFDPVTITHLGPLQQYEKLKKAILQQTDPVSAAGLQSVDMNDEEKTH